MPVNVPRATDDGSERRPGGAWAAGAVTRIGLPTPVPELPEPPEAPRGPGRNRRLWWFAGAAGSLLVIGLVVVLGLTLSGGVDPLWSRPEAPTDVRPPLARKCPPPGSPGQAVPDGPASPGVPGPTGVPRPEPVVPTDGPGRPLSGKRTVDPEAGISYATYGAPWQPWRAVWSAGTLEVPYKVGQHFVTEREYDGFSDYHASILSAAVPAAENDALTFDLECVGRQVTTDVRTEYYPQPNRLERIRDGRSTLGGLPAWVSVFRLHFSRPGLRATDELAAVACIDVGRSTAAVLYISVPGTHRDFDWVVEHALSSVRPA
ncbi:hypothetical protein O7626_01600 [Micromonospora sp. WMMD1102]|uniref:hypothetical protein n=1 Tax=Micromonospora sp. WMMD1102 TaxID=3016105 RepID=UPI002414F929|nr:hypothetical protein [Micromonospora sp. WMMD1102]MDG4784641.1 hypothetical protein [Micromonospora sp. WMMD1102]